MGEGGRRGLNRRRCGAGNLLDFFSGGRQLWEKSFYKGVSQGICDTFIEGFYRRSTVLRDISGELSPRESSIALSKILEVVEAVNDVRKKVGCNRFSSKTTKKAAPLNTRYVAQTL